MRRIRITEPGPAAREFYELPMRHQNYTAALWRHRGCLPCRLRQDTLLFLYAARRMRLMQLKAAL